MLAYKLEKKANREEALMPQILTMLQSQGAESLKLAQQRLLTIRLKDTRARKSIESYAKNWTDVIHPGLLSLSSDAVSKRTPVVTDLQVMILLLTAAMDIHDDVLDKSEEKNGRTTLYGKFGENLAILIGDAILMEGLLMLNSIRRSIEMESFDRIFEAVKETLLEVGNAHLMELEVKTKTKVVPKDILNLIEKKAAIFEGISEIGAIAGNGSKDQIIALKAAARSFGYLVMLREEFIDMYEPTELSSRIENEYPPLPILIAMSDPRINDYIRINTNQKITKKSVQELINLVYENEDVIKLRESMNGRVDEAIKVLDEKGLDKNSVYLLTILLKATLEDL